MGIVHKVDNEVPGKYAEMFEQEYFSPAKHSDYQTLFGEADLSIGVSDVHNGYFSIDKKKRRFFIATRR